MASVERIREGLKLALGGFEFFLKSRKALLRPDLVLYSLLDHLRVEHTCLLAKCFILRLLLSREFGV